MLRSATQQNAKRIPLAWTFGCAFALHVAAALCISFFGGFSGNVLHAGYGDPAAGTAPRSLEVELKQFPVTVTEDDIIELIPPKPKPRPRRNPDQPEHIGNTEGAVGLQFQQDYTHGVLARLHAHKYYPESAKRRGFEGVVHVRFRVHADGSIANLGVDRGSKHSVLNDAALTTVRRAAPFPAFSGRAMQINVAIEYVLQ